MCTAGTDKAKWWCRKKDTIGVVRRIYPRRGTRIEKKNRNLCPRALLGTKGVLLLAC